MEGMAIAQPLRAPHENSTSPVVGVVAKFLDKSVEKGTGNITFGSPGAHTTFGHIGSRRASLTSQKGEPHAERCVSGA